MFLSPVIKLKYFFLLDCLPPYRTVMSAKNFKVSSHGRPGKQDKYIGDGLISMIEYDLKPVQTNLKEFNC